MTAGIAHDFNNVLSLILGYSEMLMRSLNQPQGKKGADALLGTIIDAAQDAAKMFSRLRDFYRPVGKGERPAGDRPERPGRADRRPDQAALAWAGDGAGRDDPAWNWTWPTICPPLSADAAELREMLTNLIFNAVDAMPKGGTLRLHTRLEAADNAAATPGCRGMAARFPGWTRWCSKWPTPAWA